jgi:hypothetical protein
LASAETPAAAARRSSSVGDETHELEILQCKFHPSHRGHRTQPGALGAGEPIAGATGDSCLPSLSDRRMIADYRWFLGHVLPLAPVGCETCHRTWPRTAAGTKRC